MLKADVTQWVGKTETLEGGVTPELASMAHATLADPSDIEPSFGGIAPALWHWAAFNDTPSMASLADDGHPHRGGFLPPVNLPRRMWAGGSVTFHNLVHVGAHLTRRSTILSVEEKSDTMTFVTVGRETFEDDTLLISETQDIVYLPIPEAFSPPKPRATSSETEFSIPRPITTPMLFRYSSITFNAHRIHYDLPYAQEVEKYPGLVVHGPMQATLLLNAAIRHTGRQPAEFTYRGVHPMFHTDPLHLMGYHKDGDDREGAMRLCTGVPGAHQGMQATVKWRTDP